MVVAIPFIRTGVAKDHFSTGIGIEMPVTIGPRRHLGLAALVGGKSAET